MRQREHDWQEDGACLTLLLASIAHLCRVLNMVQFIRPGRDHLQGLGGVTPFFSPVLSIPIDNKENIYESHI